MLSAARCYGRLGGGGEFGRDGAGAAMWTTDADVGFRVRSMSAFGKADPKAERDCIVSGRALARRWRQDRRWRCDRASIREGRHGVGGGGARMRRGRGSISMTIIGAPQCRQTKVGTGALSAG